MHLLGRTLDLFSTGTASVKAPWLSNEALPSPPKLESKLAQPSLFALFSEPLLPHGLEGSSVGAALALPNSHAKLNKDFSYSLTDLSQVMFNVSSNITEYYSV